MLPGCPFQEFVNYVGEFPQSEQELIGYINHARAAMHPAAEPITADELRKRLRLLINSAASAAGREPLDDITDDDWCHVLLPFLWSLAIAIFAVQPELTGVRH